MSDDFITFEDLQRQVALRQPKFKLSEHTYAKWSAAGVVPVALVGKRQGAKGKESRVYVKTIGTVLRVKELLERNMTLEGIKKQFEEEDVEPKVKRALDEALKVKFSKARRAASHGDRKRLEEAMNEILNYSTAPCRVTFVPASVLKDMKFLSPKELKTHEEKE